MSRGGDATAAVTAPADAPVGITVHYDFASSLCYVAHRVMPRIAQRLEPAAEPKEVKRWARDLGIDLADAEIEAGCAELERRTLEAADAPGTA